MTLEELEEEVVQHFIKDGSAWIASGLEDELKRRRAHQLAMANIELERDRMK